MVRLLLLRHAKSSWDDAGAPDYERPLNLRGRSAAPMMGRHMADHALRPDRVLCSAARRTRETFAGIVPYLSGDFDAMFLRAIYQAGDDAYPSLIRRHGGAAQTLLLIGHNPAIQSAALRLIGRGNPDIRGMIADKFPTAGLAVIDFDFEDWSLMEAGSGRVVAFFRPRELELVDRGGPVEADE
ncbi:MAG TPA: histidine phosphatase family protein [Methylomirabilota bacterium]|nr:histidine phosphatase family protein [Methylomirabilota bacterium]